jgi:hypothetical protein
VTSFFIRARDAVGAPDVRLHDLRHFNVTQLIRTGMDIRTVADFLGHSDPSLTLRVYSHAIEERNWAAATIIGQVLASKKVPVERHPAHKTCDVSDETDSGLPGLAGAETVGRITVTQLDWWNAHSDVLSEAVAVIEWDELHVERRTERYREKRAGTRKTTGRIPDAVLVLPSRNGTKERTISIELDRSPRNCMDAETVIKAYIAEKYDQVLWYVRPNRVELTEPRGRPITRRPSPPQTP